MIQNDLRGDPCLPMEDPVLERTGKELIEKLKAQGFDIHDPRDDRDVIITHEIEHTDSRIVGGERGTLKALSLLGFAVNCAFMESMRAGVRSKSVSIIRHGLRPCSHKTRPTAFFSNKMQI
ncbi:MAG: hypothetical protein OXE59_05450 [Bacteroidetes bacterium]|nr:hypothetical protein [Bacteroidota bacterium]